MATNQPQNLAEWHLHSVLKRTNLIQYYDSFIRQDERDILKISNAEDKKFKDVMEKVGMAKKPLHVRQFRIALLEWMTDRGKSEHIPRYLKEACDATLYPATTILKTNEVSNIKSRVPQMTKDVHGKQTKGEAAVSINKSEKPQLRTTSGQTQSVIEDEKQNVLFPYYDVLLNKTVLDKTVLDNLISSCVLMIEDREEIIKPTTQRERNKVLLDILTERPYCTFHIFKDVLIESDPYNSDVQELVSRMQCTGNSDQNISCHEINVNVNAIRIQKNYKLLVNNIVSTTDVTDYLIENFIIQHEDREEICASGLTTNESNRRLIDKLLYKNGYHQLLKALQHAEYIQIAHEVSNTVVSKSDQKLYQIGINKFIDRHGTREQNIKDFQFIRSKIEELASTQDGVIPKHILEQFERRLDQWKEEDRKFVNIEAEKQVMKNILTESCITIIGNSGTGKSFLSRHVALTMKEQGYCIIPCDNPGDIRQWFKLGRKTVFVFDDVCGRYTLNQQIFTDWKQRHDHIISLFKDKCCKIICTCKLEVFKEEQFSSLIIFKMCNINLSSQKYRLNAAEKFALAKVYFKENACKVKELSGKYDFFPLLCSLYHKQKLQKSVNISNYFNNPFGVFETALVDLYRDGKAGRMKYCSLVLCVMFNNTLQENNFSTRDRKTVALLDDLLDKCELNKGSSIERLKKSLETLKDTYVVIEDSTYKIIHDKLFDFLAKYFGEKMIQSFIDHANTSFISERFIWKSAEKMNINTEFAIRLQDAHIKRYIDRLLRDWEDGFVDMVFFNRNMKSSSFTKLFINDINKQGQSKQELLACTQDSNSRCTALVGSCYVGNVDLIKWLIRRNSDINYSTDDGWFPLLWASQEGHVNVVVELLKHSADVNQCNKNGASPLYIACQNGHVGVVKELLQHSPEINQCSKDGTTPLQIACYNNRIDIVHVLLQCDDVNIDICDNAGCSSLYVASQEGYVAVVKELLQHSANINQSDNEGASPLYIASEEGHVDVVTELLKHSAEVNHGDNDDVSPLHITCQEGHVDVVKELLQYSANVNQCDKGDVSPLYIASQEGHVDVVQELLHHSADVNQCNKNSVSPLYIASQEGYIDVVKTLLRYSADVTKCKNNGASPLYIASQKGYVGVVKELLEYSAEVNKCRNNGASPLYIASQEGHVDVVKELLLCSGIVNQCHLNEATPLYIASQKGHINIVKILLRNSAEVNKCKSNGASPLFIASRKGYVDVVKELLQYLAEVNKCKNNNLSPLHIASQNGHINVVKELLKNSADVNRCDSKGRNPLSVAHENGHTEIEAVLLGKGSNKH